MLGKLGADRGVVLHLNPVNVGNDVASLRTRTVENRIFIERQDLEAITGRPAGDAEHNAALDITVLDQVLQQRLGFADRNRKAKALVTLRHDFCGVDRDDLPRSVQQRTARVAGVDRCIGLQAFNRITGILVYVAGQTGDDALGRGPAKAARIAQRHHAIAEVKRGGITEFRRLQAGGIHLDDRQIGVGIGTHDLRVLIHCTVVHGHVDARELPFRRYILIDDAMAIGDDITVLAEHDAACRAGCAGAAVIHGQLHGAVEVFLDNCCGGKPFFRLRFDVEIEVSMRPGRRFGGSLRCGGARTAGLWAVVLYRSGQQHRQGDNGRGTYHTEHGDHDRRRIFFLFRRLAVSR